MPPGIPVFGLAGTLHETVAKEMNIPFVAELYGDVKYNADGTLVIDRKKKYVFYPRRSSGPSLDFPFGLVPMSCVLLRLLPLTVAAFKLL